MSTEDMITQYELFNKYYDQADKSQDPRDYQVADKLRKKLIPQLEELARNNDPREVAVFFEGFSEFLFHYAACLDDKEQYSMAVKDEMKAMAEKAVKMNPDSWGGHFFLSFYYFYNLSNAHSGSISAVHKGQTPAESMIGTAFKIFAKGVTFGATSVASNLNKSNFTNSVRKLVTVYQANLNQPSVPIRLYLKMTSKMFNLAELCEELGNTVYKDIYLAIKNYDVNRLDYDNCGGDSPEVLKKQIVEFVVLSDSRI